MFLSYHVTANDHVFKGCVTYWAEIVSHYLARFSGYRPSGSCDKAAKIFYVTLQDHGIKGSGDFVEGNPHCISPLNQN